MQTTSSSPTTNVASCALVSRSSFLSAGRFDQRDKSSESFFKEFVFGARATELSRSLRENFECLFRSGILVHKSPQRVKLNARQSEVRSDAIELVLGVIGGLRPVVPLRLRHRDVAVL